MDKSSILEMFSVFSLGTGGITSWLTEDTDTDVFDRLCQVETEPLTPVQLNQLLVLAHEAPVSDGYFNYYWSCTPSDHPYDVTTIDGFRPEWVGSSALQSLEHLRWGLERLYIDGLLFFGNVRSAYRELRSMSHKELVSFYRDRRFDTEAIERRGPALPLKGIAKDDRYLISEMACKSYGDGLDGASDLREALLHSYEAHVAMGNPSPTIEQLLDDELPAKYSARQQEFAFSADEVLTEVVESKHDLESKFARVAAKFAEARELALANTRYYLSMVSDLDVYVATSMRTRTDFRRMADTCERIFGHERLSQLNLRYFDPTMSAADGHEDKGLIECLMVKCAKVLVYCAGDKESWGKDAEAAMALSLGKPVIFLCDHHQRSRFYREVHPLSRLIEFETGVAVGAIVTDRHEEVSELLARTFENKMSYKLEHDKPGFLRLKDRLTDSVVRLQTNNRLLAETFWNHYHGSHARSE